VAPRIALATASLVAVAYFGVAFRDAVLLDRGTRVVSSSAPSRAALEAARRDLEDARFLNPDTQPLLAEGALLVAHGQRRGGVALVERVVNSEPKNLFAWSLLANAAPGIDPALARRAAAEARRLSPPVPPG